MGTDENENGFESTRDENGVEGVSANRSDCGCGRREEVKVKEKEKENAMKAVCVCYSTFLYPFPDNRGVWCEGTNGHRSYDC